MGASFSRGSVSALRTQRTGNLKASRPSLESSASQKAGSSTRESLDVASVTQRQRHRSPSIEVPAVPSNDGSSSSAAVPQLPPQVEIAYCSDPGFVITSTPYL